MKWFTSNHALEIGDIVLITDLMTKLNYPKIGRVTQIDEDGAGVERYFKDEYKRNKKSFSVVKRPAQSLCIVMKKDEQERDKIADSVSFIDDDDLTVTKEKKKRAGVKFMKGVNNLMKYLKVTNHSV